MKTYQAVELPGDRGWQVFALDAPSVEIIRCETKAQMIRVVAALNAAARGRAKESLGASFDVAANQAERKRVAREGY